MFWAGTTIAVCAKHYKALLSFLTHNDGICVIPDIAFLSRLAHIEAGGPS